MSLLYAQPYRSDRPVLAHHYTAEQGTLYDECMHARGFTHVSVHAYDLEESARFYKEVFGMEEIPAPNFSSPVRWLRVGDLQLRPDPVQHLQLEPVAADALLLGVADRMLE